jgi:hypothetical protein
VVVLERQLGVVPYDLALRNLGETRRLVPQMARWKELAERAGVNIRSGHPRALPTRF